MTAGSRAGRSRGAAVARVPQPFPYQGSKRVIAARIVDLLPQVRGALVEPFAGSAAVSLAARAAGKVDRVVINDVNGPLMDLWRVMLTDPDALTAGYARLWHEGWQDPAGTYLRVRDRFSSEADPAALMYLLRRCVKAAVRYNAEGKFNQSADKRRIGARPDVVARDVTATAALLSGRTTVSCRDYTDVLAETGPGDVVYMDPPYQGTSGRRDQRYLAGLAFDGFVAQLEELLSRGVPFILSYDGRTGDKTYGRPLPASLGLRRLDLDAGPSAQATLLGRSARTTEAVFVSPGLERYR